MEENTVPALEVRGKPAQGQVATSGKSHPVQMIEMEL
jgi:hypothetical protein